MSILFALNSLAVALCMSATASALVCIDGYQSFRNAVEYNNTIQNTTCPSDNIHMCSRFDIVGSLDGSNVTVSGGFCIRATSCAEFTCTLIVAQTMNSNPLFSSATVSACGVACCNSDLCNTSPSTISNYTSTIVTSRAGGNGASSLMISAVLMACLAIVYLAR